MNKDLSIIKNQVENLVEELEAIANENRKYKNDALSQGKIMAYDVSIAGIREILNLAKKLINE